MTHIRERWILLFCISLFFSAIVEGTEPRNDKEKLNTVANPQTKLIKKGWIDKFHDPTDWLKMGADFRFRTIFADNIDTLNDDALSRSSKWKFERYRTRWWTKWLLDNDMNFNTRLVWEFFTWTDPARKPQSVDFDEVLFDRFNLTIDEVFNMPLRMIIGRQNIILGKGWLILDGTPLDGSRTIFMDAARFTYSLDNIGSTLDMIYVNQGSASDRWLAPFNDREKHLTQQDEQGVILYLSKNYSDNHRLEGFFIYKNDNPVDSSSQNFPSSTWSKKAEIFTLGGAYSTPLSKELSYRGDFAFQIGDKEDKSGVQQDLHAFGTKNELRYDFHDKYKSSVHLVYEFLSGDDPDTATNEQFDPLWGEWPQWSELYIYTYSRETMVSETTNLHRLGFGHQFNPCENITMETDYNLLWADNNSMKYAGPVGSDNFDFSDSGKFRGQLLTCWLKYQISKQVKGHLLGEYLLPGGYYADQNQDDAYFLRFNIEYTF